ncbi:UNVERIFIED_CONTAM: hypothetical protein Slati_1022800 [Sesamum latifolium]|uniref:Zinc knuckle CX2CX4HX4C domain-containing protein n=1 Tax=Sesamum latifolium TaxID=2727402 RepID=A0AAW2XXE0_9LAMI
MDITFIEEDRFLLKFVHPVDRDRVLSSGPWAFEKNLIVLARVSDSENPIDVNLDRCDFHVRIHGLPIGKMTKEVATFIGNRIGCLCDSDQQKEPEAWGSFMRLRVTMDVTKPLPRVLKIRTVLGDEQLVSFSYERLPNFCYLCGCLGHISKWCKSRFLDGFVDPGENTPYGPWLLAMHQTAPRTRFPQGRRNLGPLQPPRPRFSSRVDSPPSPLFPPKRGGAIFGEFQSTAPRPHESLRHVPDMVSPVPTLAPVVPASPLIPTPSPPTATITASDKLPPPPHHITDPTPFHLFTNDHISSATMPPDTPLFPISSTPPATLTPSPTTSSSINQSHSLPSHSTPTLAPTIHQSPTVKAI